MKRIFYFFILVVPSLSFASIGDQLNSLLDKFFKPTSSQEKQTIPSSSFPLDIPEINIPDIPTEDDILDFRQQIKVEEETLADFEMEISESQRKLWQIKSEKNILHQQLKSLDETLGLTEQKLETLTQQEEKWKKELKNITREKSDLQALIRVKKKEQNEFMNKKIIQEESFENEGSVSLLKWFFSDKTVAQILEEKRTIREKETQYKLQLKNLQTLKKKLDEKEAHTALLFHTTSSLREKITKEKQSLDRLTEAKARLIARLEYSYGKTQKEIANYQREQNQSTVLLQNLHQALEKIKTNEKIVVSETDISKKLIFDFPLPIERKITAHFRDEAYQERFGKEHIGVDFFAPQGTDILAPSDGIVQKVALNGYGYSYLVLNHGNELYTVYGHISDSFVNEGQKVFKGDKIALTGGTPGTVGAGYFTTGPHLHWEVFDRGKHRNPMHYLD